MSRVVWMRKFGPTVALIVLSALVVAACGDEGGGIELSGPSAESTTTSTSQPEDTTTKKPTTTVAEATTSTSGPETTTSAPATGEAVTPDEMAPDPGWGLNATAYNGRNGLIVGYACPPNGTLGNVWGTGVYTDDSSVCTAATHAGFITVASGGTVYIRIAPGQSAYEGTEANGVTSIGYGSWGGSFTVLAAA